MLMIQQNYIHGDDPAELQLDMVMIQHNYIHGDDPA